MKKNFRLYLILALALVLRLVSINQSFWLDEAIQAVAVSENSLKSSFTNYFPGDFNPPLNYLISWLTVRLLGNSEIVLRLPSVIFGVLNVWLVYLLSKNIPRCLETSTRSAELTAEAPGVDVRLHLGYFPELAALLLATAPLHIYYSQEARPYVLASLLATWSMYELWRVLKKPKNTPWRYILSTTLMLYSHYMTWLLMPVQLIIVFILRASLGIMPRKVEKSGNKFSILFCLAELRSNNKWFFSWLTITILLIPWLSIFLKQLKVGKEVAQSLPAWSTLGMFSFKNLALIPVKFLIGRISIENNSIYGLVLLPIMLLVGWLLLRVFIQLRRNCHSEEHSDVGISSKLYDLGNFFVFQRLPRLGFQSGLAMTISWLVIPITLGAILSLKTPVFQYFRFLFVLPAFYLLLAYSISSSSLRGVKRRGNLWKYIMIFAILVINLTSSLIYLFNPKFHREDWRGLVNFISQKEKNTPVIILEPVSAPFKFYDKNKQQLVGYSRIEKVKFLPKIWLIKYSQPIFEPEDETEKKLKNFGFEEILEKHFRGVIVKYLVNPSGLRAYVKMQGF